MNNKYYGYDIKSGWKGEINEEFLEFPTEGEYDEMLKSNEEFFELLKEKEEEGTKKLNKNGVLFTNDIWKEDKNE